jgi:hypothetical protein
MAVATLTGCAGRGVGAGPPTGDPYIAGTITALEPFEQVPAITKHCVPPEDRGPDEPVSDQDPPVCAPAQEQPARILVEEQPDGNKASLTITRATTVWRDTPDGPVAAQAEDLRQGDTVAAWVSGPVAESFPVQATADAVVVRGP